MHRLLPTVLLLVISHGVTWLRHTRAVFSIIDKNIPFGWKRGGSGNGNVRGDTDASPPESATMRYYSRVCRNSCFCLYNCDDDGTRSRRTYLRIARCKSISRSQRVGGDNESARNSLSFILRDGSGKYFSFSCLSFLSETIVSSQRFRLDDTPIRSCWMQRGVRFTGKRRSQAVARISRLYHARACKVQHRRTKRTKRVFWKYFFHRRSRSLATLSGEFILPQTIGRRDRVWEIPTVKLDYLLRNNPTAVSRVSSWPPHCSPKWSARFVSEMRGEASAWLLLKDTRHVPREFYEWSIPKSRYSMLYRKRLARRIR